jgi:hypothetical protein
MKLDEKSLLKNLGNLMPHQWKHVYLQKISPFPIILTDETKQNCTPKQLPDITDHP